MDNKGKPKITLDSREFHEGPFRDLERLKRAREAGKSFEEVDLDESEN